MATIAEKLNYLNDTKTAIKQAIVDKGVAVADTDTFASYAEKICTITDQLKCTWWVGQTLFNKLNVAKWNISRLTDMSKMFGYATDYTIDLSAWDTSNVTTMQYMFYYCQRATINGLGSWDTGKVANMQDMFSNCQVKNELGIDTWDTSNVTTMLRMFSSSSGFTTLNLSGWDTGKVTDMQRMFQSCAATSLDLSNWDVSKVSTMQYMFYNTNKMQSIDVTGWKFKEGCNIQSMFNNCTATEITGVDTWDVSGITSLQQIFTATGVKKLDLSKWDTSKVTNMNMLSNSYGLEWLDISNIDFSANTAALDFWRCNTYTLIGDHTLEEVENGDIVAFKGNTTNIDWGISYLHLDRKSLLAMLKGVGTVTSGTITLGSTLLAKLTDDDKKIATDKGWTLA